MYGRLGNEWFFLEPAITPTAQRMGLLGRNSLPIGRGMIFVFPQNVLTPFTMQGMQFPIDILFLDQNGIVMDYFVNAQPNTGPYVAGRPFRYVIELPAGTYVRNFSNVVSLVEV